MAQDREAAAMTPREQAAFTAGIEAAQQAAAAALQGLAEGLRAAFLDSQAEPDPIRRAFAAIPADPADSGTVECPTCKGRRTWIQDSHDGHLHGECETDGCLRWMQ